MEELKRYTNFEALKLSEHSGDADQAKDTVFADFEAFLKRLQSEHANAKKTKKDSGKQPNR